MKSNKSQAAAAPTIDTSKQQPSTLRKNARSGDYSKPWYLLDTADILSEERRDEAYLHWVERKLAELTTSSTKEKLNMTDYIKLQQSQYAHSYRRHKHGDDICGAHLKRRQLLEEIDKIDQQIAMLDKETRRDFEMVTNSMTKDLRTAEQLKQHRMQSNQLLSQTQAQLIQFNRQREAYLQGKMDQWRTERVCRTTFDKTFCDNVLSQMDRYLLVRAIVRYGLIRFARTVLRSPAAYRGKSVLSYHSPHTYI